MNIFAPKQGIVAKLAIVVFLVTTIVTSASAADCIPTSSTDPPRQIEVGEDFKRSGYSIPVTPMDATNQVFTHTDYRFLSCKYLAVFGTLHAGVDIDATDLSVAFAISWGRVLNVVASSDPGKMVVAVEHFTRTGVRFVAVYGHVQADAGLEGKFVTPGERLGIIRKFGTPSHLHFGVNLDRNQTFVASGFAPCGGWGRIAPSCSDQGWVEPIQFLKDNPAALVPPSHVDGVGSLVDPSGTCFGCNTDVVQLHPHPDTRTTAIFQIYRTRDLCEVVELTSSLGQYTVTLRRFDDEHPGASVGSGAGVFVAEGEVVRVPLITTKAWQIITVTTKQPLSAVSQVIATCVRGAAASIPQRAGASLRSINHGRGYLSADPALSKLHYAFGRGVGGGSASLIYTSQNVLPNGAAFGKTRDIARNQLDTGSTTFAQIEAAPGCRAIRVGISDDLAADTSFNSHWIRVSIKAWDAAQWSPEQRYTTPARIQLGTAPYTLVRVRTGATKTSYFTTFNCLAD